MSDKVKHTPLPWRLGRNGADYAVFAGGERFIADCDTSDYEPCPEDDANAAFIVRAVNSHYALVEALKAVIANISYAGNHGENCRFCDEKLDHEGTFEERHAPDCEVHKIRSALKLAEAGQ